MARAGQGTQLELATFGETVQPLANPTDLDKSAIEPTSSGTDYCAAMAWARDLVVRSRKEVKELHILTDLQRSGLDRGDTVRLPNDVEVHLHDVGRAFPKNVGVTGISIPSGALRPGDSITVAATVFNASPVSISNCPIRLHLEAGEGKRELDRVIDLEGGATGSVNFALEAMPEGLWLGYVEASTGDEITFDDRRFLAVRVAPPARVLVVDGDPGRVPFESETYFLQAALRLAAPGEHYAKTPFDPRSVDFVAGTSLPDLEKTEAVVLANVGSLSASDAKRLGDYVERGGGLLVFGGDRVSAEGMSGLLAAGLGVGTVLGTATATELPWRLERWAAAHPVFKPFADPEFGDLRRPTFTSITRIKPDQNAQVLSWFRGDEPALLERTKGRGKVLWFTSACDRAWGDWPRGRMYVPMIHQMVGYVSGIGEDGRIRHATAGDGGKPGIEQRDGAVHVVNTDPLESETARCTPAEFADKFGFTLPEPAMSNDAGQRRRVSDERSRSDELWPWLALALAGLLLVENFLANRTAA